MNLSVKKKFGSSLTNIVDLFSDIISNVGYDVQIKYRVERNRQGYLKGVCLKNWMWLGINDSKNKIIDDLVIKTKLNKDIVLEKYSELIDSKFYGISIATYIMQSVGYSKDNIFHNNIYNPDLFWNN